MRRHSLIIHQVPPQTRTDMPTKRKASLTQNKDEPTATRRCTRATAASFSSSTALPNPPTRGVHASPTSTVKSPGPKPPPESTTFSTPKRKDSDRRLTRSQTKVSSVVNSRPPNRALTSDREDDQSDDELASLPNKKVTNRKGSEKSPTKASQLPRVFVEILSPAPRTPKHLTAKAVASPASPTPTRARISRRSSPSPLPSSSPTKAASAKRICPPRPSVQPALHAEVSGLSDSSSRYLPSCLYAQKRAILHALLRPKTAVFVQEDENGEPSTNAVALEQLKALLTGTLERGEGNSCLLIGPRGSGKSYASFYTPDTSAV
jgi:hypothetical protein